MDSGVPTHSITASAPTHSVIFLIAAAPSSPRSVTMSVAPSSEGELLLGLVAAHDDDPPGTEVPGGDVAAASFVPSAAADAWPARAGLLGRPAERVITSGRHHVRCVHNGGEP